MAENFRPIYPILDQNLRILGPTEHWMVILIQTGSQSVAFLDSRNKTIRQDIKRCVQTALERCPEQPNGDQCGYYSMRFIKSFMTENNPTRKLETEFKRNISSSYTIKDINKMRDEWANFHYPRSSSTTRIADLQLPHHSTVGKGSIHLYIERYNAQVMDRKWMFAGRISELIMKQQVEVDYKGTNSFNTTTTTRETTSNRSFNTTDMDSIRTDT
ncbi:hypothetical protein G4B88_004171 [Cannabis sativa]|uniref:Ubiquitin-like protease family profile domain-containing protein n=1 Tax=Cannabis sativa TaxID=3483 RepID=A0A7J6EVP9_CANSA|nr:hypothetical protein G4B88_004171 [Cannabis sativa]